MPITATPILDRLLFDKLVSQEHHDLARQRLDALPNEPYSNTGEALIWLRTEDILSDSDLEEMETLSMSQAGFAGNAARIEAVGQLHVAVQHHAEACVKETLKQSDKAMLDAMFPGPRWLWLSGGAVLAVVVGAEVSERVEQRLWPEAPRERHRARGTSAVESLSGKHC
ncbi:hypothetical protein [Ralstonia sp. 1138]|uniref:hypothetical protein n=1 Tax=Ralstonia sp. 1138 TaxID=3156423 RepID=UPI0033916D10